jgi:hypothetical protein
MRIVYQLYINGCVCSAVTSATSPTSYLLRCTPGVVGFLHTNDYSPTMISLHVLAPLIVHVRTASYVHVVKYINYILLLIYMYCTVRYRVLLNDVPFRAPTLYVKTTLHNTIWFTRICTITLKHPPRQISEKYLS